MTQLRENFYAVELTALGDEYKSFRILEPDKKWTVPYLKYSYRSIYHTKRRGKDFYCSEEDPLEPGTWQIICTSKEATEEQAGKIVEWTFYSAVTIKFMNYFSGKYAFNNSVISLGSLLASVGLTGKNYLIIQKM